MYDKFIYYKDKQEHDEDDIWDNVYPWEENVIEESLSRG